MIPAWILDVERANTPADARKSLPSPLGYEDGQAYFDQIMRLLGESAQRAQRLAARWRLFEPVEATAAWAYRAKAVHDRLDGRWTESVSAFRRAGEAAINPLDALTFQVGAVDSLGRLGRVKAAEALAGELAAGLARVGHPQEAGQVWLNAANALLWHDRYDRAKRLYRLALDQLGSRDEALTAAAQLGLSSCELYGGHPREASEAAMRALEVFRRLGREHDAVVAEVNIGQASLLMGRADDALDAFLKAQRSSVFLHLDGARLEEFVGDAYSRLNLYGEAEDAYKQALSNQSLRASRLNHANVEFGLGSVLLAQGQAEEALAHFMRAASLYRSFGNLVWHAACSVRSAEAHRLAGRIRVAKALAKRAVNELSHKRAPLFMAEALLELAECTVEERGAAKPTLRTAAGLVRRQGYAHLAWRVDAIRARSQPAPASLRHYRRMMREIALARTLNASFSSRASFLADKKKAIGEYMATLLATPSPRRVQEVLDVVRTARSVTLLEELLSAQPNVPQGILSELQALREEINTALANEQAQGPARRIAPSKARLMGLQRRWVELNREARVSVETVTSNRIPDVVFVEASNQWFRVENGVSQGLPWQTHELAERLKSLRFDLLAPLVNPSEDPRALLAHLSELEPYLGAGHGGGPSVTVSPEGLLWQVPWSLISAARFGPEVVLAAGAWSGRCEDTLPARPKTAVWYHDRPDLPHIREEVEVFMRSFPDSQVCLSAKDVRASLASGTVDLLHIATHARFHPTNPLFSYLSFEGGQVTAAEIARSSIRPRLVTLSACETGMVSSRNTVEPEGLARAFLARGAASVIASSWPLDDKAAHRFAYTYYRALFSGRSVVQSVAIARDAVRSEFSHPYYWGSFTLFGGYVS